jgi:hypothetical protein
MYNFENILLWKSLNLRVSLFCEARQTRRFPCLLAQRFSAKHGDFRVLHFLLYTGAITSCASSLKISKSLTVCIYDYMMILRIYVPKPIINPCTSEVYIAVTD